MRYQPGHKALRKGRSSEPGHTYLVTFTTRDRRPLFHDFLLAVTASRTLAESMKTTGAESVCWVLMPDHFHAVLRLGDRSNLSRCVQRMKGHSSMACRKITHDPSPAWARAFYDHAVRADEDLEVLARYVVGNPVRAGLTDDVMLYPWWDAEWL